MKLRDLCVSLCSLRNCSREKYLMQRSQRYAELAERESQIMQARVITYARFARLWGESPAGSAAVGLRMAELSEAILDSCKSFGLREIAHFHRLETKMQSA